MSQQADGQQLFFSPAKLVAEKRAIARVRTPTKVRITFFIKAPIEMRSEVNLVSGRANKGRDETNSDPEEPDA